VGVEVDKGINKSQKGEETLRSEVRERRALPDLASWKAESRDEERTKAESSEQL